MNFKLFMQKINPVKHPPKILRLVPEQTRGIPIPEQTRGIPRHRNGRPDWTRIVVGTRIRVNGIWDGYFSGFTRRGLIICMCDDGVEEYSIRSEVEFI